MRALDIIRKKRDGGILEEAEVSFLVSEYVKGSMPDYQMASFLMAAYLNGMSDEETLFLTAAMLGSGKKLDLSGVQGIKIDKHSTGGVGDKMLLLVAPILASMGLKVPSVAGRGLGHTGGTLDKLASIPGLRTDITAEEFRENLNSVGFSIMGQTPEIAPADRKLYALRDATATVESTALITASVMSKKLSEGPDALLVDVKCGSGAFMKTVQEARNLARLMVFIGERSGVKTAALITDMDNPIGRAVGNSLEVKECLSALKGGKAAPGLTELALSLSAWMLHLADCVTEETRPQKLKEHMLQRYKNEIWDYIEHGDAFKKFVEFIDAQHGDPEAAFNPSLLPAAGLVQAVVSPGEGYIKKIDAYAVGRAAMLLGAGRERMDDEIDPAAGILLGKLPADFVKAGEPFATLHTNRPEALAEASALMIEGLELSAREPSRRKPVLESVLAGE